MSVQRADLMGTRHTLNITYPTPRETLAGSPTLLPTSEPASATFSYTVQSSDLPTFGSDKPLSFKYLMLVFAGGKNTDAGNNRTLCYRVKKNGTSLVSSTSITVTANQYWTLTIQHANMSDVAVGDVIDIYLWQVTTDALNWDFQGMAVTIAKVFVDNAKKILINVGITRDATAFPAFTLGTPSIKSQGGGNPRNFTTATTWIVSTSGTSINLPTWQQHSTDGLYALERGDSSLWEGVTVDNHATNRPYYRTNYKITKLEWTPTNIIL